MSVNKLLGTYRNGIISHNRPFTFHIHFVSLIDIRYLEPAINLKEILYKTCFKVCPLDFASPYEFSTEHDICVECYEFIEPPRIVGRNFLMKN